MSKFANLKKFLVDATQYRTVFLKEQKTIAKKTKLFTFQLPDEYILGTAPGQYIHMRCNYHSKRANNVYQSKN
jgi:NAD(P)H-flavin reductase